MSSNCHKGSIDCELQVGDLVDWQRFTTRETTQTRKWHGQIVDEWNTNSDLHWFIVRWDISDKSGPYDDPRTDIDPNYIPCSPHYEQLRCFDLRQCSPETKLHPSKNLLPNR